MENIKIEQALEMPDALYIDLRSPIEYNEAHIPGAINVPLLEDEERALVGTIYKKQSPQKAKETGLAIISPKLPKIFADLTSVSTDRNLVLYCWRGGMRSEAVSHVLSLLGTRHFRLEGGYKAFRQYVNEFFQKPLAQETIVLYGLTGVGKTEILQRMKKENLPAIDLEELAHNRGSVFGHIGLPSPPSQKQFEGELFWECRRLKKYPCLVVEGESQRIGRVTIPHTFFQAMKEGRKILVSDTMENRIKRLVATYMETQAPSGSCPQEIREAVVQLRKRLGPKKVSIIIDYLEHDKIAEAVRILLEDYYDPLYRHPASLLTEYDLHIDAGNMEEALDKIKCFLVQQINSSCYSAARR